MTDDPNPAHDARSVFTDIYLRRAWIHPTADRELYSGPGSNAQFAIPYAEAVKAFVAHHDIRTVVDLGCGDFRVGQHIADLGLRYVGVDVVDPVVAYNTKHYASDRVTFLRLDMSRDELPDGELCLVREVFQHLSNAQIRATLNQMSKYRWCLVTDRQSRISDDLTPNLDREQGEAARADLRSALRYDLPPFDQPDVAFFLDVPAPTRTLPESAIKTVLIRHAAANI